MNKEMVKITAKEFVELFYKEKNDLLKIYFEDLNNIEVGIEIKSLNLTEEQMRKMESIINNVIVDTMYTTLLGLDGCELTCCGEIEEYAYEYFQENKL